MLKKGTREILRHMARISGLEYKERKDMGYLRNADLSITWFPQRHGMFKCAISSGCAALAKCEYNNIKTTDITGDKVFALIIRAVARYNELIYNQKLQNYESN